MRLKGVITAVLIWLSSSILLAQHNRQDYERILIPVSIAETPGAFGSRWTTEIWIHNSGNRDARGFHSPCQNLCIPVLTGFYLRPGETIRGELLQTESGRSPGVLLYVPKEVANTVAFNLRAQDLSRQSLTWGTEIPIVRDHELRAGKLQLLNIPLDARFRHSLRLYSFDVRPQAEFVVRFVDQTTQQVVAERSFKISAEATSDSFAFVADSLEIHGLTETFPEIVGADRVMLEVEPITPGMRIWGFVTVTNNETQHLTTITP